MFSASFWSLLCLSCGVARAANPTVSFSSGVVVGTATGVANQPSVTGQVNAYLGIPFANSPPVRFAPPTAPKQLASPFIAQKLPPACIQQFAGTGSTQQNEEAFFNNPGGPPPAESEDCLYLNVFAPQDASPTSPKAVLFWIFGGNLQFGTASLMDYNGSSLAVNHDVVVVVPNYRTNIFGFSNSPEIPFGSQNSGFLDQRMALAWVQQNIKQFGGDPTQVTIFGESAGGYSVKQLLANPPSPLPFRAAILESEALGLDGNGSVSYDEVLAHFNCTNITCLRQVPATAIQSYIDSASLDFPPVDGDGTAVANVLPTIASRKFAQVPTLIGTNLNETTIFLAIDGLNNGTAALSAIFAELGITDAQTQDSIIATYAAVGVTDGLVLANRLLTDTTFTCPAALIASTLATNGYKVNRYQYQAVFPNTQLVPNLGAYHTSEIPEVWGTYPLDNALGAATPTEVQLSAYMQGVWSGFAKNPSAGTGWPRVGTNAGVELGVLGGSANATGENTQPLLNADYACALLDPISAALGFAG